MAQLITESITHIGLDADDTLWSHENVYVDAKVRCARLLSPYLGEDDLEERLYTFEKKNLAIFGYGVKGFMLSMLETAIELSQGRISGQELQQIIDLGKEMLLHPIDLLAGVEEALDAWEDRYPLIVITKGDLFAQENKLARSGIADRFAAVEIVSEKKPEVYAEILDRHGIAPENFLMIGNSLRSDVLPVLEIGAQAIHIPFEFSWHHEVVESRGEYVRCGNLFEVIDTLSL